MTDMTTRTPPSLSSHRGPLATPPDSPESITKCSFHPTPDQETPSRPTIDVGVPRVGAPVRSPLTYYRTQLHARRQWSHGVTQPDGISGFLLEASGFSSRLSTLRYIFKSLLFWACDVAKGFVGILMFCLLIWTLLEMGSEPSHQSNSPWVVMRHLPLPSATRSLGYQADPSCQLGEAEAAVLQFLSDHIRHATAIASLSVSLAVPLRAFLEAHTGSVGELISQGQPLGPEDPFVGETSTPFTIMAELLDNPLVDFTSSSFIGKSFSLALDEVAYLVAEPVPDRVLRTRQNGNAHSHAIYWRTASNLLLEYSAARPRARDLLYRLQAIHGQISPMITPVDDEAPMDEKSHFWWRSKAHAHTSTEKSVRAFVGGLEVAIDNLHRLAAYLDWITDNLASSSLTEILKLPHKTDFSSCMAALQELFAHSTQSTPLQRLCPCMDDYKLAPSSKLGRIEITVPSSPTIRVGW
ncbi:hypothetical protein HYDPIDRAFT_110081 [Hydnomerulius pinastri MD-312]|nr:hypothetical protein HYDPIDRAFT_110081 [Hydnomerulius pinastri MD-312]